MNTVTASFLFMLDPYWHFPPMATCAANWEYAQSYTKNAKSPMKIEHGKQLMLFWDLAWLIQSPGTIKAERATYALRCRDLIGERAYKLGQWPYVPTYEWEKQ